MIGLLGSLPDVHRVLLHAAVRNAPCLVIDCANVADPHALYPAFMPEDLERVDVVEVELLYKLRAVLETHAPRYDRVYVTAFHRFMSYHDPDEDRALLRHAWELLRAHPCATVAVHPKEERLARHYCDALEEVRWATP